MSLQALSQRAKGPSYPLKRHHNQIKREMYIVFAKQGGTLVDVACGRGGDLQKWRDTGIHTVHGYDVCEASIEEAKQRLLQLRMATPLVTFEVQNSFEGNDPFPPCDMCSCMFALHYAFKDELHLRSTLLRIYDALRPGGTFFGICADGDQILAHPAVQNKSYTIAVPQESQRSDHEFGRGYSFCIHDTVVEENQEFIAQKSTLERMAKAVGFTPATFPARPGMWQACRPGLASLQPRSSSESDQVSAFYFAFAFQRD